MVVIFSGEAFQIQPQVSQNLVSSVFAQGDSEMNIARIKRGFSIIMGVL